MKPKLEYLSTGVYSLFQLLVVVVLLNGFGMVGKDRRKKNACKFYTSLVFDVDVLLRIIERLF
jgi:hypothetical protein